LQKRTDVARMLHVFVQLNDAADAAVDVFIVLLLHVVKRHFKLLSNLMNELID
jgi:hypothetical protein